MKHLPAILISLYILMVIFTFGHAYNSGYRESQSVFASTEELNASRSIMAGLCWPLYWSVHFTEGLRP